MTPSISNCKLDGQMSAVSLTGPAGWTQSAACSLPSFFAGFAPCMPAAIDSPACNGLQSKQHASSSAGRVLIKPAAINEKLPAAVWATPPGFAACHLWSLLQPLRCACSLQAQSAGCRLSVCDSICSRKCHVADYRGLTWCRRTALMRLPLPVTKAASAQFEVLLTSICSRT